MSRANVKPLVHWAIGKGYALRFNERSAAHVAGIITTPAGTRAFAYDPIARLITLDGVSVSPVAAEPAITIAINEYGWEVNAP